jgi:STE24 endopeptidase
MNCSRPYVQHEILLALAFFGVLMFASDILTLPFQWYSTFVIEEKYGFNKTTVKTFVTDKLKGYLIGAILGGGILSLLIYLIEIHRTGFLDFIFPAGCNFNIAGKHVLYIHFSSDV